MIITGSPLGKLAIYINNNKLCKIDFLNTKSNNNNKRTTLSLEVVKQLQQYFHDSKYKFTLPLNLQGTEFQQRVWQALLNISAGKTKTYGELAQQLNTSARAIGNACRKNPIPIIIPCHRVVAKNGLGGFGGMQHGKLLNIKKWLLHHENI